MAQLTINSTLKDLLGNPETKAILEKHMGELIKDPRIQMGMGFPLKTLFTMASQGVIPQGVPEAIESDLNKLNS